MKSCLFYVTIAVCFADSFQKLIIETVIRWAKSDFIQDQQLIREMFSLLHRQYDAVDEVRMACH